MVDTQAEEHRVDKSFAPDKEPHWKHSAQDDGWTRAHNSIRAELKAFRAALHALGDAELAEWQITAIICWWNGHREHVYGHHTNEDAIMNPFLRTRFHIPEKILVDHRNLIELMDAISAIVDGLDGGGGPPTALRAKWEEYEQAMLPHLREEEELALPLCRAYFTPQEVGAKVREIMKRASAIELGSFWHTCGSKAAIMGFMRQEGIPPFLWHLLFRRQRTAYRRHMVSHIESLHRGEPVVTLRKRDFRIVLAGGGGAAGASPSP